MNADKKIVRKGGRPTKQAIADREKTLRDVSRKLFLTRGYSDTSIEQICAMAHIAKRTFYGMYSSKEALFSDLMTNDFITLFPSLKSKERIKDADENTLRDFGFEILRASNRRTSLDTLKALIGDFHNLPAGVIEAYRQERRTVIARAADILEILCAKGIYEIENIWEAADDFMLLTAGLTVDRYISGPLDDAAITERVHRVVQLFSAAFRKKKNKSSMVN